MKKQNTEYFRKIADADQSKKILGYAQYQKKSQWAGKNAVKSTLNSIVEAALWYKKITLGS